MTKTQQITTDAKCQHLALLLFSHDILNGLDCQCTKTKWLNS